MSKEDSGRKSSSSQKKGKLDNTLLDDAGKTHMGKSKHLLRYLNGQPNLQLRYQPGHFNLNCYATPPGEQGTLTKGDQHADTCLD